MSFTETLHSLNHSDNHGDDHDDYYDYDDWSLLHSKVRITIDHDLKI